MMDNKIICTDVFENYEEGGKTVGFRFLARLPYYRGLGLSMIEDVAVTIDGLEIPRDAIRFSVRGQRWTLDEMETEHGDRWNFGEKAEIAVLKPRGLTPGEHRLECAVRMRVSYLPFIPTTKDVKTLTLAA